MARSSPTSNPTSNRSRAPSSPARSHRPNGSMICAARSRTSIAQIIDPFGRCDRAGEDGALDLFDVGFEVGDDRSVALDHLVQDCPEHRVSTQCEQFGVLFEPHARAAQLTCDTLSNRYDKTRADEDADL